MSYTHLMLGFTADDAMKEVQKQCGAYVSYTHLKRCYERLLNMCNQLEEPASNEDDEEEEQCLVRTACIKAFLLLLVDYTIFANKNSRSVSMI